MVKPGTEVILATTKQLMKRYEIACDLKQAINEDVIAAKVTEWIIACGGTATINFVRNKSTLQVAAWDARDAKATRATKATRAAWDARVAWNAWNAWVARDAWDARVAWNAWNAWDVRVAWDLSWLAATVVGANQLKDAKTEAKWMPLFEAFESGALWMWIGKDTIYVSTQPTLYYDANRRLHREDGPAFEWLPDASDYYWHGVNVPKELVEQPETITHTQIRAETNAEVRRVMVERYDAIREPGAYLMDIGAQCLHSDQYGTLYKTAMPDDEPLVMVKVKNSTPEPDGTYQDYFLRVPPNIQTAREAVAWTWQMSADEYAPAVES